MATICHSCGQIVGDIPVPDPPDGYVVVDRARGERLRVTARTACAWDNHRGGVHAKSRLRDLIAALDALQPGDLDDLP